MNLEMELMKRCHELHDQNMAWQEFWNEKTREFETQAHVNKSLTLENRAYDKANTSLMQEKAKLEHANRELHLSLIRKNGELFDLLQSFTALETKLNGYTALETKLNGFTALETKLNGFTALETKLFSVFVSKLAPVVERREKKRAFSVLKSFAVLKRRSVVVRRAFLERSLLHWREVSAAQKRVTTLQQLVFATQRRGSESQRLALKHWRLVASELKQSRWVLMSRESALQLKGFNELFIGMVAAYIVRRQKWLDAKMKAKAQKRKQKEEKNSESVSEHLKNVRAAKAEQRVSKMERRQRLLLFKEQTALLSAGKKSQNADFDRIKAAGSKLKLRNINILSKEVAKVVEYCLTAECDTENLVLEASLATHQADWDFCSELWKALEDNRLDELALLCNAFQLHNFVELKTTYEHVNIPLFLKEMDEFPKTRYTLSYRRNRFFELTKDPKTEEDLNQATWYAQSYLKTGEASDGERLSIMQEAMKFPTMVRELRPFLKNKFGAGK